MHTNREINIKKVEINWNKSAVIVKIVKEVVQGENACRTWTVIERRQGESFLKTEDSIVSTVKELNEYLHLGITISKSIDYTVERNNVLRIGRRVCVVEVISHAMDRVKGGMALWNMGMKCSVPLPNSMGHEIRGSTEYGSKVDPKNLKPFGTESSKSGHR